MSEALFVPERFRRNSAEVRAMGPPAETGKWLIDYMCERLGVADLGELDVLDFGCGSRFTDAIINKRLPIKSYTGIELDQAMVEFLSANVADPRFAFHHWDARNPMYNPAGFPLSAASSLPTGERKFDLICMFSVITHQLPEDAEVLFRIFRRCIRPQGRMFFSATLEEMEENYRELIPDQPTGRSAYSPDFLQQLVERSGWQVLSREGKRPRGIPIQDSLLCTPAP